MKGRKVQERKRRKGKKENGRKGVRKGNVNKEEPVEK